MFAAVHGKFGDGYQAAELHGLIQKGVCLFAGGFWRDVVGGLKIDRVDVGELDEFVDLHFCGRLSCGVFEFVGVKGDEAIFLVFEPFDDGLGGNDFCRIIGDGGLFDRG